MHYILGRDLDGDGVYEFIQNLDMMILTEDPYRALQVTKTELEYIDMPYLNANGFYAFEADRFRVPLINALLFRPTIRGYRPRVAPPPRRPRRAPAPRPVHMPPPPPPVGAVPRGPVRGPGPIGPGPIGPGPLGHGPGGRRGPAGPGGRRGPGGPGGRGPGGPFGR